MVLIALVIGIVYALPNLYGEDPAVQISGARGASVDMTALDSIKQTLESNDLPYQSIALEDGTVFSTALKTLNRKSVLVMR